LVLLANANNSSGLIKIEKNLFITQIKVGVMLIISLIFHQKPVSVCL